MATYHDNQHISLLNQQTIFFINFLKIYFRRPENIRRHVTAVPNRSVQSATNTRTTRPLKKAASVQRKSRPLNSNNTESSSSKLLISLSLFYSFPFLYVDPPRSSSANNNNSHTFRPPLRLAPASPLFRNRFK
jgi:hypothetical protein